MTQRNIAKRLVALSIAVGFAGVGLTACSSSTPASESPTPAASASESPAEPVTIEYWHRLPDKDGMIKVQESADAFTKDNPEITVKAVKFEGNAKESYEKITSAVAAGNAPCLAQASYDGIPAMLVRGELEDVSAQVAEYKSNFAAGPWGQTSPGGKTYGLPQDTGPLVYYYDSEAFDALGLKAPTTWEEYWSNAEAAKAAGKYTSVFFKDEAGDWFSAVEAANGNSWFSAEADAWKVAVDSEPSKKVATDWQNSMAKGTTLASDRWDDNGAFAAGLKDGSVIGYVGAAWEAAFNLDALGKEETKWQVAQMPANQSGPWGGSAIVVLKGCPNVEQALKFANWYNTNLEAMTSQGLVPAAKGAAPTPENIKKLYGGQDVMAELQKAADIANPNWTYAPTWPAVKQKLIDNAAGGKDLVASLADAQAEAISTLEGLGLSVAK